MAIKLIIAPPGYGKTTELARICKEALKKKMNVYSNVYIENTYMMEITDINFYLMENGILVLDEAGLDFDNRAWKNFSEKLTRFFKLHRHYNLDVYLVSQDYDIDSKIRALATSVRIMQKSLFYPYVIKWRTVVTTIDIAEDNSDIVKIFKWKFLLFDLHYHFAFPLWKLFNSYYRDKLNIKVWKKWTKDNEYLMIKDFTTKDKTVNLSRSKATTI
jgi:hypothetical protein